jgi:alkanesulfonate monooxygenase SsuD/methylene tetrahydromethanopterin reductase-like flavin-dependent oxidoreductase (luciferase family)
MRFGLFFQAPESPGRTHAERYAEMFDLIALAESLGFDVAWLAELHFGGAFSLLANPLMMVPVIAQRTKRIRIGTAVTLLPLQHPLSCAEQAATADVLSGGRLEFGVGRGSIPSQFHGFRVSLAENRARFDEALEIIRLAWTKERFSYRGAFHEVEDVSVVPRPLQEPHPPIRVAVHTAESFAHIGDTGLPIYSGTTTTPLPQLREHMALYRERLAAAGHPWQRDQMALMLPVHVGESPAAAGTRCGPGCASTTRTSGRSSRSSPTRTACTCPA